MHRFRLLFLSIIGGCLLLALIGVLAPPGLAALLDLAPGIPARPESLDQLGTLLGIYAAGGCELPCFLGFRPGQTTADEVIAFAPPAVDPGTGASFQTGYHFYGRHIPYSSPDLAMRFIVEGGLLAQTVVELRNASGQWLDRGFSLPALLAREGTPTQVFMRRNESQVYVFLFYEAGATVIGYTFPVGYKAAGSSPGPSRQFCPGAGPIQAIRLQLQDGAVDGRRAAAVLDGLPTVERLTGLDTATFVRRVVEEPGVCIELGR